MGYHGYNRHAPRRWGGCCAPFAGGAGSPSNTMWPGPRSISAPSGIGPIAPPVPNAPSSECRRASIAARRRAAGSIKISLHPFSRVATKDMGRKLGLCLFRGPGSLSSTRSPGPRPTSVPSGTLIHQTVWRQ